MKNLVIVLPKNEILVGLLQKKLKEYKGRAVKMKDFLNRIDAKHKVCILKKVLTSKKVSSASLLSLMKQKKWFKPECFEKAIGVINEYCTGGMKITFWWPPSK